MELSSCMAKNVMAGISVRSSVPSSVHRDAPKFEPYRSVDVCTLSKVHVLAWQYIYAVLSKSL